MSSLSYLFGFAGLVSALALTANADGVECTHWSGDPAHAKRVQVKTTDDKLHFLKSPQACPASGDCAQKQKAFLLNEDVAYLVGEEKDFDCVAYVPPSGPSHATVGWMPKAQLTLFQPWTTEASDASTRYPVMWASRLQLSARNDIDAQLAKPFDDAFEGTDGAGKPVKVVNCKQALDADFNAPNIEYKVYAYQVAECQVLQILKKLKPSKTSFVYAWEFSASSLKELPASTDLLISNDSIADAKKADAKGMPLSQFNKSARVAGFNPVKLHVTDSDGNTLNFEVVAKGDYDGDGIEDVVVRQEAGTSGTYGASLVFVLTRTKDGAVFKKLAQF